MSNFGRQSVLGVVFLLVLAPCNVAREAIVGAAAPLVPTLAVVQDAPLAPAVGNVLDMDADNTFAYAVTDTSVVKAALSDLANQGSHVLTTTAGMQWTGFTTLQVDDRALYITAKRNVPAFRNSEPYQLLQFDKNTMMFLMSRKLSLGDGVPYSIAQDSASLYLGTYSFPGKILRVGKFGAMHIMESLDLPQGANDVRSMELDRATETLYANCNTMPGRVVKIKLHTGNHDASPMSVTGTAIFQAGVGHVATGTTRSIALASKHAPSGSRVYVATNQQPANVVAIDAELMETMGSSVKLSPGEDLASALVEDRDYLYIGLWEKATIVRLTKTPFARESAFDLLQGAEAGRVTSMLLARVQSSNFLIVGMQGSPSRLAKITGPVQPVHQASAKACEASGWGEWSPCSATCGRGRQARARTIVHAEEAGGSCPQRSSLHQESLCYQGDCPHSCSNQPVWGQVWTEAPFVQALTCDNAATHDRTNSSTPACQCPPDRPYLHSVSGLHSVASLCVAKSACGKYAKCPANSMSCRYMPGPSGRMRMRVLHGRCENEQVNAGHRCHSHQESAGRDVMEGMQSFCRHRISKSSGRLVASVCECLCYKNTEDHCFPDPCTNGGKCVRTLASYTCQCTPGFSGARCESPVSCTHNTCLNGGTCYMNSHGASATCQCRPGYSGPRCATDVNDCSPSPCKNGGACVDGVNSYQCHCTAGYEGTNCERMVNTCLLPSPPCQNGGECQRGINSYSCKCAAGFRGRNCEIATPASTCSPSPCKHGATCAETASGYTCACTPGFAGTNCELAAGPCATQPCLNAGVCTEDAAAGSYTCACAAGYQGTNCESQLPCTENPCQNAGVCSHMGSGYKCACAAGFKGRNCEINKDDCATAPCQHFGVCNDRVDGYTCTCKAGFRGVNCETNINDCDPNPCLHGGVCMDGVNDYTCTCRAGFSGSDCEVDIDDCAPNPCHHNGTCIDSVNGYTCGCETGFEGKNCETQTPVCCVANTASCLACQDGVSEEEYCNGKSPAPPGCEKYSSACLTSPCKNGGVCAPTGGSYNCTCTAGFKGAECAEQVEHCNSAVYKHYRLNVDASNGAAYWCIRELSFYDAAGGVIPTALAGASEAESEFASSLGAGHAFDGPAGGFYCSHLGHPSGWLKYSFSSPTLVGSYKIESRQRSASAARRSPDPSQWTLEGSDDGVYWTVIDKQAGENAWAAIGQTKSFDLSSSPCRGDGSCANTASGYTCSCSAGFTGARCQDDVDECQQAPCKNGGSCQRIKTRKDFDRLPPHAQTDDIFNVHFAGRRYRVWSHHPGDRTVDEHVHEAWASGVCKRSPACPSAGDGSDNVAKSLWKSRDWMTFVAFVDCGLSSWARNDADVTNGGPFDLVKLASSLSENNGMFEFFYVCEVVSTATALHTCTCTGGFSGASCLQAPATATTAAAATDSDCNISGCQNGGTCMMGENGHGECVCTSGFGGPLCSCASVDLSTLQPVTCSSEWHPHTPHCALAVDGQVNIASLDTLWHSAGGKPEDEWIRVELKHPTVDPEVTLFPRNCCTDDFGGKMQLRIGETDDVHSSSVCGSLVGIQASTQITSKCSGAGSYLWVTGYPAAAWNNGLTYLEIPELVVTGPPNPNSGCRTHA